MNAETGLGATPAPDPLGQTIVVPDRDEADDTPVAAAAGSRPATVRSPLLRLLREWGVVLAIALAVAFIVRLVLFSPFYIPSGSMEPTLRKDDKILVNKLSYKLHDVHRGDVVVFDRPPGVTFDKDVKDLVKRVIGIPGDTIEIRNCLLSINGQNIDEPYIDHDAAGVPQCTAGATRVVDPDGDGKIEVPAGKVFVMGDNRHPNGSNDSRFWGFLDEKLIVGRAFVVYWPSSRWSWL
jgi:signal peptidase I